MKKKVMMSVMAAVMSLSGSITALAAPEVISVNGNNTVFDWEYYANTYPDVTAALGTSREAMIQHYVSFGQRENREAYAAGTDAAAILAAYQGGNPAAETIVPVQTEKKQLLRVDRYWDGEFDDSASYEYDAQGNLIKAINPDFDSVSYEYSYDNQGNLIKEIKYDYNSIREGTLIYDSQGKLIRKEYNDDYNGITRYIYDSQGNLIKETDEDDYYGYFWAYHSITYSYDSQGNLIKEIEEGEYGDGCSRTYSYDDRGNCVQMVWTAFLIDGNQYYYDDSSDSYFYTYDEYGNLIKEVVSRGYDGNLAVIEYRNTYAN